MPRPAYQNLKLVLTGSGGIGKSTLTHALAGATGLPEIEEQFDEYFQRRDIKNKDPQEWASEVHTVFDLKSALEDRHGHFVSDRSALDLMALWCRYKLHRKLPYQQSVDFFRQCQLRAADYSFVIIPPWGVFDIQQVDHQIRPGVRRAMNKFTQFDYHCMLVGYAHQHLPNIRIIEIPRHVDGIEARTSYVLAQIDRRLKHIESKDKRSK